MLRQTKIIYILLFLTICLLCYFCYESYKYKHKYIDIKQEIEQNNIHTEFLTPLDCLVIAADGEKAYIKCNTIYHNSIDNHSDEDVIPISKREYLLYCYIFAIRDKNLEAAAEFSSYYLDNLQEKRIAFDTNMFMAVKDMASQVLSDTCNSYPLLKFTVAESLQQVYSKIFKDTVMEKQYDDSVSKYLELMKLMK